MEKFDKILQKASRYNPSEFMKQMWRVEKYEYTNGVPILRIKPIDFHRSFGRVYP